MVSVCVTKQQSDDVEVERFKAEATFSFQTLNGA
jgi:hypothetical protein